MTHKLTNGMKTWKGSRTIQSFFFFFFGNYVDMMTFRHDDFLHQEQRGQVNYIVMEYFNSILFLKYDDLLRSRILISLIYVNATSRGKFVPEPEIEF